MDSIKYAGIDLHQSTCVIAIHDESGKVICEAVIATEAEALRSFLGGIGGTVHVAFEVGTQSGWLYQILKPVVCSVTVADIRKHKRRGSKTDRADAHELARLLRKGDLQAIYQGDANTRRLRDLAHAYLATVSDATRVMNRIKAVYRSWAIPCAGRDVYYKRNRESWLSRLPIVESRLRAGVYYQQLDLLKEQRKETKRIFLKEARRYPVERILRRIPGFGPIRSAFVIAVIGTPYRFRTNRQLWSYSGLAVLLHTTSDHEIIDGAIRRKRRLPSTRGLKRDFNRMLKMVYKGAAKEAIRVEPFAAIFKKKISKGIRAEMALLSIARKLATISLILWKRGEAFNTAKLISSY